MITKKFKILLIAILVAFGVLSVIMYTIDGTPLYRWFPLIALVVIGLYLNRLRKKS
jgi:uncharacterized membrane protein YccC